MPSIRCPHCAAELAQNACFCSTCGAPLTRTSGLRPAGPEVQALLQQTALLRSELDEHRIELQKIHGSRLWQIASIYWAARRAVRALLRGAHDVETREAKRPSSATWPEIAAPAAHEAPLPSSPEDRVAARFAGFRQEGNRRFFDALARHLASLENDPCLGMYFEFAITANERGEKVAELLSQRLSLPGKKYLDIGCAYAGFLVAFARRGAEVVGLDIDQQLLALAEENLADAAIEARLCRRDATRADDLTEFRSGFDIITANDVIEHVEDPASLLENIGDMLRPGGIAYFEIPNRHAVPFVREDGHYRLFGITLLDHPDAKNYYALHAPGVPYGVGHYLELAEYERLFTGAGLRFEVLKEDAGERAVPRIEEETQQLRSAFEERRRTVPEPLRELVAQRVQGYIEQLDRSPRRSKEERARFVERYGTGFWRVIGTKA